MGNDNLVKFADAFQKVVEENKNCETLLAVRDTKNEKTMIQVTITDVEKLGLILANVVMAIEHTSEDELTADLFLDFIGELIEEKKKKMADGKITPIKKLYSDEIAGVMN